MHRAGFTARELKLLETLESLVARGYLTGLEQAPAVELKPSPITVRTRLSRMRSKYA